MARVFFSKDKQAEWLNKIFNSGANIKDVAGVCGLSERTIRDWRREKFKISEKSILKLSKVYNLSIPKDIKIMPDFWYVSKGTRKGALKRMELYGPPGTPEGRKKGGQVSQARRRENPEKYRQMGCNVRKNFACLSKSEKLAEVVGIILGDGGVTNYQLKITLDSKVDREYSIFVQNLISLVFGEKPSYNEHGKDNTVNLIISGANLIDYLVEIGISKGNKILRQVDFPEWVWEKRSYQIACVRGLFDTDGGAYFHNHWTKGIKYRNFGLCFTSWSRPLLNSVHKVLAKNKIKHSIQDDSRIYIYDLNEVKKYFRIFQPSNPKFTKKLDYHGSNSRVLERKSQGGVA